MHSSNVSAAIVVAAICLVIAGGLIGGRYQMTTSANGLAYAVDRFTGDVVFCSPSSCKHLFVLDLPLASDVLHPAP
jgi:hypothetical protein